MEREEASRLLDIAAGICVTKHCGQRDKMGHAYFMHPMRVAMRCASDEEKMVALLHDVIEDCGVTAYELVAEGFPQEVVDAVLAVTRRAGESYEDFVARAKAKPLAREVKKHDLEDNLDIFRLDEFTPDMAARYAKYLAAYRFLQSDEAQAEIETVEDEPAEDAPAEEEAKPTVKTIDDLYSELRAQQMLHLKARSVYTGGTDYMRNRLIIRDKDKTVIDESSVYNTILVLGRKLGFDAIDAAGVEAKKGRYSYRLVCSSTASESYKRHNSGWYVLSNVPVVSAAVALNELFELLNVRYIACVLDR